MATSKTKKTPMEQIGTLKKSGNDFGNCYYKGCMKDAAGEYVEVCFPNGYTVNYRSTGDSDEMYFEGKYYIFNKRLPMEKNKTASKRMLICTLYAHAQMLEAINADPDQVHEFHIGVDIPAGEFGRDSKKAYESYFTGFADPEVEQEENMQLAGEYTVQLHGKKWTISFARASAFPQGMVAISEDITSFSELEDSNPEKPKNIVVFDLGGGTLDIIVIRWDRIGQRYKVTAKLSEDIGVNYFSNDVIAAMKQQRIDADEMTVRSALYKETSDVDGFDKITATADEMAKDYIRIMMDILYENKVPTNYRYALIGGGSDMMASWIEESIGADRIICNKGNMANARGCLEAILSDD